MARRPRRNTQRTPPHDAYLDVRLSKLRHRNRYFPEGRRIYEKACSVHTAFQGLNWGTSTPRFELSKATDENTPLRNELVGSILELNELMAAAATQDDAARWILDHTTGTSFGHRVNSSGDHSADGRKPRSREEPSSGRRDHKRVTISGTSDSDHYHAQPRRGGRAYTDRRQVTPYIFHAAQSTDSDKTPFPPRIARRRTRTPHSSRSGSPPNPMEACLLYTSPSPRDA